MYTYIHTHIYTLYMHIYVYDGNEQVAKYRPTKSLNVLVQVNTSGEKSVCVCVCDYMQLYYIYMVYVCELCMLCVCVL